MIRNAALLGVLLLCSCGGDDDNQDPEGAKRLYAKVREQDYRSWMRAPSYEERQPSMAPHGGAVDIYVNEVVAAVLSGGEAAATWPPGSIVVKDGYNGATLHIVAIMEKQGGGWFWTELDGAGEPLFSGRPDVCLDCHAAGSDFVRAFELPR